METSLCYVLDSLQKDKIDLKDKFSFELSAVVFLLWKLRSPVF